WQRTKMGGDGGGGLGRGWALGPFDTKRMAAFEGRPRGIRDYGNPTRHVVLVAWPAGLEAERHRQVHRLDLDDVKDTPNLSCARSVEPPDLPAEDRAADHGRVQHAGNFDVDTITRAPGDDLWPIHTISAGSHDGKILWILQWRIIGHRKRTRALHNVSECQAASRRPVRNDTVLCEAIARGDL